MRTMKASELIKLIQEKIDEVGDTDIVTGCSCWGELNVSHVCAFGADGNYAHKTDNPPEIMRIY